MKKVPVYILFSFFLFAGCKKKETNSGVICTENAVVHYVNPPVPDICQLWLTVDSTIYLPLSLDTAFMSDTLKVRMCYKLTGNAYTCGFISTTYRQIDIQSIQRR